MKFIAMQKHSDTVTLPKGTKVFSALAKAFRTVEPDVHPADSELNIFCCEDSAVSFICGSHYLKKDTELKEYSLVIKEGAIPTAEQKHSLKESTAIPKSENSRARKQKYETFLDLGVSLSGGEPIATHNGGLKRGEAFVMGGKVDASLSKFRQE